MQDNRSQKEKDVAFEDKAWMDMRELLDKEMPVRKKDRTFLWWWSGAGFLLVLVMGGGLFFLFNKNQAGPLNENNIEIAKESSFIVKKDEQLVLPKKDELSTNTNTNTNTEEQQIVSMDKSHLPLKKETKYLNTIERNNTPNNKKFSKESINKIQKGTAYSIALDNRIYPTIATDANALKVQHSIINPRKALEGITHSSSGSPTFNKEEKVSIGKKKEQLVLAKLPLLELMDLPMSSDELTFPVYAIPKKNRMDWAIVASLGTFKLTRFNEYSVGIKTTYQWHPKWRLGTGLNYHYFRLNGLVKADDSIQAFNEADIIRAMEPTIDAAAGSTSDTSEEPDMENIPTTPIEQVFVDPLALAGNGHYLSIPLFLEYQISSRVKLDAGTAYYYKLSTSYDSLENRLKPNDWTAFMGVGFEFTPYFDLRLGYERNWSKHRSKSVNRDFLNANNFDKILTEQAAISPLEGRLKISGIWRF